MACSEPCLIRKSNTIIDCKADAAVTTIGTAHAQMVSFARPHSQGDTSAGGSLAQCREQVRVYLVHVPPVLASVGHAPPESVHHNGQVRAACAKGEKQQ